MLHGIIRAPCFPFFKPFVCLALVAEVETWKRQLPFFSPLPFKAQKKK